MADYLDELVQKITTKADLKGFDDLERKQRRAIKTNDLLGKSFRRAFGIFFGIQGIRSIINASRDLDLLQKSIKGLTGSVEDWKYLRVEAYRTGTSLKTIAGAYKNFYSAARGSGFNGNQIQSMFSGLLTAGRGIGASQQQIGGALTALEQMLSKGKVSAEELRKQLGNALPGAVEIAQRAMGVTAQEFEEMMQKGISAAEFVPKFIAQAQKELGKGFAENIKSLDFALVNLSTAWLEFQANILQGEAGEALTQLVSEITQILRSQELLNFIKLIGKGLAFVIKHIKTIAVLWSFNKFIKLIAYIRQVDKAITATRISTGLLDAQTKTLMLSYRWLVQGKVGLAFRAISKAIWGSVSATVALYGQWTAILGTILLVQDVLTYMFDKDRTTKTLTGYIIGKSKEGVGLNNLGKNPLKELAPEQVNKARQFFKAHPELKGMDFSDTGAPIYWADFKTPGIPYKNNPTQNNTNSSTSMNNNISINITAPNSQPEAIAKSVGDALTDIFTNYNISYA